MSDPYKDIGFDANPIGFGRRAGIVEMCIRDST